MSWTAPIFDRTQTDIEHRTPKAYLNAADMNRIESNTAWISERENMNLSTREWAYGEFLTQEQINRIVSNARGTQAHFGIEAEPYETVLRWQDLNEIERILFEANRIYVAIQSTYTESGSDFSEAGDAYNFVGKVIT